MNGKTENSQLKTGVVLSYICIIVQGCILLLYTPLMLRMLGQNEYGTYEMAVSVVSYLGLLDFGFSSAYVRFYARFKAENDEKGIATLNGTFFIVLIVLGLVTLLVGCILIHNVDYVFGGKLVTEELELVRKIMNVLVINVAFTLPMGLFDSYIIAHEKYFFQRFITLLQYLMNPFFVLVLLFMGYRSIALAIVTLFLTIMKICVSVFFCYKKIHIEFDFKHFSFPLLKEVFVFSFFVFVNMIVNQINWNVDKFLVGKITGAAAVAVYALGAQINQYYLIFSTSISSVFIPRVNKMVVEERDSEEFTKLFTKIGRIQFIVVAYILGGFILLGRFFIQLWGGKGYDNAYEVTLWLIVPVTIPLIQNIGIEIQRARNLHKFRSIVYMVIAVINILVSIPLIKKYGEIGAAMGTFLGLVLGNGVIMNIYYHKKMELNMIYFWKKIIEILIPFGVSVLCCMFFKVFIPINCFMNFVFVGILYSVIYFILVGKWGMNSYEKGLIKVPLMKIKSLMIIWREKHEMQ